jgi:hypothetical protein
MKATSGQDDETDERPGKLTYPADDPGSQSLRGIEAEHGEYKSLARLLGARPEWHKEHKVVQRDPQHLDREGEFKADGNA